MTAIENLIIDFKAALKENKFGDDYWESVNYQYMVNVVHFAHQLDKSVPKFKIMRLIHKTIPLKNAYESVIEFLEKLK